jgi:hypothetical protein
LHWGILDGSLREQKQKDDAKGFSIALVSGAIAGSTDSPRLLAQLS